MACSGTLPLETRAFPSLSPDGVAKLPATATPSEKPAETANTPNESPKQVITVPLITPPVASIVASTVPGYPFIELAPYPYSASAFPTEWANDYIKSNGFIQVANYRFYSPITHEIYRPELGTIVKAP